MDEIKQIVNGKEIKLNDIYKKKEHIETEKMN